MKTFAFASLASLVALALAGCGAAEGTASEGDLDIASAEEAIAPQLTSFKLYEEPGKIPNRVCDIHTRLDLATFTRTARARFVNLVDGLCEIYVEPNDRTYNVRLTAQPCGSKVFEGVRRTAEGVAKVRITDHRTRLCKDLPPAKIIVEETVPGTSGLTTTTLYSAPVPSSTTVTLEGTLRETMGLGGENTGVSLETETSLTELVLTDAQRNAIVDGRYAQVKGTTTVLTGIETGQRGAVEVSDLLVCPAPGETLNCMPRINVRLSNLCAPENRAFIGRCPNVLVVH